MKCAFPEKSGLKDVYIKDCEICLHEQPICGVNRLYVNRGNYSAELRGKKRDPYALLRRPTRKGTEFADMDFS